MRLPICLFLSVLVFGAVNAQEKATLSFPKTTAFLPRNWIEAPILAEIEPISPDLVEEAGEIIAVALGKYPSEIRERYLKGVHIVGSLRFHDVGYGGTYLANGKQIVLVYREFFDRQGFEQRFHHEFSSLLLKQNQRSFEEERWLEANDPEFQYRAGGVIEEQEGERSEATRVLAAEQKKTGGSGSSLLQLDPELMKQGFLTPYNRVSIEQDFNETAAHLFANPDLWGFCEKYPRIDHKVDVLIDFYRRLDKRLDRLYFRRLTENAISAKP
ncbi:MAG: hypothetical protein WD342_03265 [Verrucomicrobiales bacterium]